MNRRVIVGGAGTACLITAAVGFGLWPTQDQQRTRLPQPKKQAADTDKPAVSLRKPLPAPTFDPAVSKTRKAVPPRSSLLGSASTLPSVASSPEAKGGGAPKASVPSAATELAELALPGPIERYQPLVPPGAGQSLAETKASSPTEASDDQLMARVVSVGTATVGEPAESAESFAASEPEPIFLGSRNQPVLEIQAAPLELTASLAPLTLEPLPQFEPATAILAQQGGIGETANPVADNIVTPPSAEMPRESGDGFASIAETQVTSGEVVGEEGLIIGSDALVQTTAGDSSAPASTFGAAAEEYLSVAPLQEPASPSISGSPRTAAVSGIVATPVTADPVAGTDAAQLSPRPEPTTATFPIGMEAIAAATPASGTEKFERVVAEADQTAPRPQVAELSAANVASYAPLTAALVKRPVAVTGSAPGTSGLADPTATSPILDGGPAVTDNSFASAPGLGGNLGDDGPLISYQDELILEVRVNNAKESDTIIGYGTRSGLYLPLGSIARILDLAVTVTDEGRYAHGWILSEDRTLIIDLREGTIQAGDQTIEIEGVLAADFDGEMFLRLDQFERLFPIEVEPDLRTQSVYITTLERFPFEERSAREARRARLEARQDNPKAKEFERVDLAYEPISFPTADIELRAVSDRTFGTRAEADVFLAGDLAFLTAESYLSGDTVNGLTASLFRVGRMDPDADLLGPLEATSFGVGDINSTTMPLGLRSVAGRGFTVTNAPSDVGSVFDQIDLRGILPAGYEVELYRNDILIGSTSESSNGQYEFLQVPVDFGLNVFRLVFFGPQGQRSEKVERITVGDGRLAKGKLVYSLDATQRDRNLLGVKPPNFFEPRDYGAWRTSGQLSYGLTSDITTILGGAWFEREGEQRWLGTAGIRTGFDGVAVRADAGIADGGAYAISGGLGGRFGRSAITVNHTEYSGEFPDETVALGTEFLRRATEVDLNTTIGFGGEGANLSVPVSARFRAYETVDGRNTLAAGVRASTRAAGFLVSNSMEFSRISGAGLQATNQLFGSFDLATLGRSKTRGRLSLGYSVLPNADLISSSIQVDHALDERTSLRGQAGYVFDEGKPFFGASGIRDFDDFTLALDANYSFVDKSYFVGLRIGFSLGRDPLRGGLFLAKPGLASSGGATLRAFRDKDGDGIYGPVDEAIEGIDFVAYNQTGTSDSEGVARLVGLGTGQRIGIQVDSSTLPDINLAPAMKGIDVVPRSGRLQAIDYPIVTLSEIEGTARFVDAGGGKGVSGVRLRLLDADGKIVSYAKTELDGYYFFERIKPGEYQLQIDPGQVERLRLCPIDADKISVSYDGDVIQRDLDIRTCAGNVASVRK
ncbi:hypothetical protein GRI34_08160 [Erythrobacter aquimaris]|uniref:SD-repeat containing protein B domain-containing protein n=1 Tax=Qipengyuania aquimaris TaxID=255984 RepID=A0A6I4TPK2_9SPHN|nr:SdrD B-like domain-containing protein [Qipengyuania aquimaris]MXO96393.1 hypothetical protein [Qipengyuania aquimaris]